MSQSLERRLANASAQLTKIHSLSAQFTNNAQKIQASKIKINQNLERLHPIQHHLDTLKERHRNEDEDPRIDRVLSENTRSLEECRIHFDNAQRHLTLLEQAVNELKGSYFSHVLNPTLTHITEIISLRDPLTDEPFSIEELEDLVVDDPIKTIDDEDLSSQPTTVITYVEHELSKYAFVFASIQMKAKELSTKTALVSTEIQKSQQALSVLEKNIAELQTHLSSNKGSPSK